MLTTQGDTGPYNELVVQFQSGVTAPSAASAMSARHTSPSQLQSWLTALTHVVASLDRTCVALVDAVLEFPWLAAPTDLGDAWVRFACALVSARSEWTGKVASLVFANFGPRPSWYVGAEEAHADTAARTLAPDVGARPTRRQLYERVHGFLEALLQLVPTLPSTLQPLLIQHFPHKRERTLTQVLYMRNLLHMSEYCEALTEPVWAAVVDHALQVDVAIQVELDELEEQGIEPTGAHGVAGALDRNMNADASDSEGMQSADVSPAFQPHEPDTDPELETLEQLSDEEGFDASDDALFSAPHDDHEPAWTQIAALASKLDAMMKTMHDFLVQRVAGDAHAPGTTVRRYQLFQTLLGIFSRTILTTFKSRHVQFLLFWFSALDSEFSDMFLGTLLSKSLYTPWDAAVQNGADAAQSGDASSLMRIAAASYVASFVARAKYIDASTTRMVLLNLCTYLDGCLEAFMRMGTAAPPPGAREHAVFYAVAQAVFYIFCFRWRDLREGTADPVSSHPTNSSADEDNSRALAGMYPMAGPVEISPQLQPVVPGATSLSFSSASSHTSGMMSDAGAGRGGWAPGLSVVQRAITSPLNPLRYCNANVVNQFAYVAQHTGFLYCYSILEANQRRQSSAGAAEPRASGEAPGTPHRSTPAAATRDSTPTTSAVSSPAPRERARSSASEEPAARPTEGLDAFFPFDPYRLRDSSGLVERLYQNWADVAPEGEEEEDEEEFSGADYDAEDMSSSLPSNARTKLSSLRSALSSSTDPSVTPESVARSMEAMSISPFAV